MACMCVTKQEQWFCSDINKYINKLHSTSYPLLHSTFPFLHSTLPFLGAAAGSPYIVFIT